MNNSQTEIISIIKKIAMALGDEETSVNLTVGDTSQFEGLTAHIGRHILSFYGGPDNETKWVCSIVELRPNDAIKPWEDLGLVEAGTLDRLLADIATLIVMSS